MVETKKINIQSIAEKNSICTKRQSGFKII